MPSPGDLDFPTFWHLFWNPKLVLFLIIFWTTFWSLFTKLFKSFWNPRLGPDPPKRDQDKPKRAIRSFKEPKNCINKYWFSRGTVGIFTLLRPPKRASRGPRRLPRGTQRAPKPQQKRVQNWTQKLTNSRSILVTLFGTQKKTKKTGPLLAPPSPASQGSE